MTEQTVAVAQDRRDPLDADGVGTTFDAYPASHRNEYVRWIDEAKKPETRRSRIEITVARIAATGATA